MSLLESLLKKKNNLRSEKAIFSHISEFEEYYQEVNSLELVANNHDIINTLPRSVNLDFEKFVSDQNKIHFYEAVNIEDIVSLNELRDARIERFSVFKNKDSYGLKILRVCDIINNAVFTKHEINKDGIKFLGPDSRKYEKGILKITHPWKVSLLLEKDASVVDIVSAYLHDTIEDSLEHSILKDWERGKLKKEGKKTLTSLLDLEQELPDKFNEEIYLDCFSKIKQKYLCLIEEYGDLNNEDLEDVSAITNLLTKSVTEEYWEYLVRIVNGIETETPERAYNAMIIKLNDRIDNSHFGAPELNEENFETNVKKFYKDSVKNIYLLEASKEAYLKLKEINYLSHEKEEEMLKRMDNLAALTNRNMNHMMREVLDHYGDEEIMVGQFKGMKIGEIYDELVHEGYDFYKNKRFEERDEKSVNYNDPDMLLEFEGSLKIIGKWLEYKKDKKGNLIDPFGNLQGYKQKINMLKFGIIGKIFSSLYLSREPFVDEKLTIYSETDEVYDTDTLGKYNPALIFFEVAGFMTR